MRGLLESISGTVRAEGRNGGGCKSALAGAAQTVVDVEFLGKATGVDDDEHGRECRRHGSAWRSQTVLVHGWDQTTRRVSRVSRLLERVVAACTSCLITYHIIRTLKAETVTSLLLTLKRGEQGA
jgi:hypothetical protein